MNNQIMKKIHLNSLCVLSILVIGLPLGAMERFQLPAVLENHSSTYPDFVETKIQLLMSFKRAVTHLEKNEINEALSLFKLCADQTVDERISAWSHYHIGKLYYLGEGVDLNRDTARTYFEKAKVIAERNNINEIASLAHYYCFTYTFSTLENAAQMGYLELVKVLIAHGSSQQTLNSALINAVLYGHENVARELIAAGASIATKTVHNDTLLHIANKASLVKMLLELNKSENLSITCGCLPSTQSCEHKQVGALLSGQKIDIHAIADDSTALMSAVENLETDIVKLLLDAGASVAPIQKDSSESFSLRSPICSASISGAFEIVKMLLEKGADVNEVEDKEYNWTCLHAAVGKDESVQANSLKLANLLIEKGANVNALCYDDGGGTPLSIAVRYKNKPAVKLLLEKNANVTLVDLDKATPLHDAATLGLTEIAQMLLAAKAPFNALDSSGRTPLHNAANNGSDDIVKMLLTMGATPHCSDKEQRTPLHCAAFSGHKNIAEQLLHCGAIVDCVDAYKYTPFHYACSIGNLEVVKLLIAKGANAYLTSPELTGLHLAARKGARDVVEFLLGVYRLAPVVENQDLTPLHWASYTLNTQVVKLLTEPGNAVMPLLQGALHARTKKQETPLHLAAWSGNVRTVEHLLSLGAQCNVTDAQGWTPLHCAAIAHLRRTNPQIAALPITLAPFGDVEWQLIEGLPDVVKLLVKQKGIHLNATDIFKRTPLHWAVLGGNTKIVETLVEGGALPDLRDNNGHSSIYMASQMGNVSIMKALMRKYVEKK